MEKLFAYSARIDRSISRKNKRREKYRFKKYIKNIFCASLGDAFLEQTSQQKKTGEEIFYRFLATRMIFIKISFYSIFIEFFIYIYENEYIHVFWCANWCVRATDTHPYFPFLLKLYIYIFHYILWGDIKDSWNSLHKNYTLIILFH